MKMHLVSKSLFGSKLLPLRRRAEIGLSGVFSDQFQISPARMNISSISGDRNSVYTEHRAFMARHSQLHVILVTLISVLYIVQATGLLVLIESSAPLTD